MYSCTRVWSATPVQQLRCGCRSPVSTRCVVYFISSLSHTAHRRTKKKKMSATRAAKGRDSIYPEKAAGGEGTGNS